MRFFVLSMTLLAGAASAQAGGSWGGYVGGWRAPGASTGAWTGYVNGWQSRGVTVLVPAPGIVPFAPPVWVAPAPGVSTEDAARQDALQRAYAEAEAARQREAQERQLAEARQREAEARAHLEEARRLDAEHQRQLEELVAAQQRQFAQQDAMLQRLTAQQAAAAPAPAPPPRDDSPGNEVYRWVDDDGVTHYSTKVPADVAAKAKPVRAKTKR
jgi:hypothetical protein